MVLPPILGGKKAQALDWSTYSDLDNTIKPIKEKKKKRKKENVVAFLF